MINEQKEEEEICIPIQLKAGKVPAPEKLDANFLRSIQDEYASRFLEMMNVEPNARNKTILL